MADINGNSVDYVLISQASRDMAHNRMPQICKDHGFTGTPWEALENNKRISVTAQITPRYRGKIAVMHDSGQMHRHSKSPRAELLANAKLMAAAPKLLKACESALKQLPPDSQAAKDIRAAIQSALLKFP